MAKLFKNKYRIGSFRLQNWDYANEAMYFVTICTKNRENYFGEITDMVADSQCIANLQPSTIGKIANLEWYKCIELRPDMNLNLGEFIVMPNHIHGIIMIGSNEYNIKYSEKDFEKEKYQNQFGPQSKNLSSIIRGYKSAVTTFARKNNIEFEWQPLFHDHIIRSKEE